MYGPPFQPMMMGDPMMYGGEMMEEEPIFSDDDDRRGGQRRPRTPELQPEPFFARSARAQGAGNATAPRAGSRYIIHIFSCHHAYHFPL